MTDVHVTVWDDRSGGGAATPALFVHNIFTWGDDPEYGFAGQRPLAADRRLLLMDRRGYGDSPDTARSDFEVDAEDVVGLLGTGAHLVGHGNGGVVALLAAARRPDLLRSLALIQPSAFTAAADRPLVADLLDRVRDLPPTAAAEVTPERFLRESTESVGLPVPPLRCGFG
ncbi:alpha/beta fold hydrolase [Streptomyces griseorubiginosus]|uniref:alpha/beta fold hydrolase n=1 Tax=Streptomyces griseorubiginosus TaxID=67304 RepID=UPI00200ED742|nr:alpha/beta fold hydrolase [Streptomyces griseorubiginosus]